MPLDFNEAIATVAEVKDRNLRTAVPGVVKVVASRPNGERDAQFETGIGKRTGGVESADGIVPAAPMLTLSGGGFGMYLPALPQDEALGVVSDRPIAHWRQTKLPGKAPTFDRQHHDLSDTMLLPFTFTLPAGGPLIGGQDLVIFGPNGDILRAAALDGTITITKGGVDPLTVATVTFDPLGGIAITVPTGQMIMGGDELAEALVKFQAWDTAMTAMLNAGAATPPSPMAGNNGSLAFNAAKIAYDAAKTPAQTTKLMGT